VEEIVEEEVIVPVEPTPEPGPIIEVPQLITTHTVRHVPKFVSCVGDNFKEAMHIKCMEDQQEDELRAMIFLIAEMEKHKEDLRQQRKLLADQVKATLEALDEEERIGEQRKQRYRDFEDKNVCEFEGTLAPRTCGTDWRCELDKWHVKMSPGPRVIEDRIPCDLIPDLSPEYHHQKRQTVYDPCPVVRDAVVDPFRPETKVVGPKGTTLMAGRKQHDGPVVVVDGGVGGVMTVQVEGR